MIAKEKVIRRIEAQIALCKEIDSDWISLTVGTGKRILELLEEQDRKIEEMEERIAIMTEDEYHDDQGNCGQVSAAVSPGV